MNRRMSRNPIYNHGGNFSAIGYGPRVTGTNLVGSVVTAAAVGGVFGALFFNDPSSVANFRAKFGPKGGAMAGAAAFAALTAMAGSGMWVTQQG